MMDWQPQHLRITSVGWVTTFQDLGRRDTERLGVPTGGAADQYSAAVANILVGNPRHVPVIETMGGEFAFVPTTDLLIAITGSSADVTIDGAPACRATQTTGQLWTPLVAYAGSEVRITSSFIGMRNYIAFGGLLACGRFLGSAAPDARMGFTQAIQVNQVLSVEASLPVASLTRGEYVPFQMPVAVPSFEPGPWTIDIIEGPDTDRAAGMREHLARATYTVTPQSNHVGLRLSGPVSHPEHTGEIVSHGVPVGALEVPPADELIVLGRYRTLTAGYPIVGFAARTSLARLAQAAPGRELRFRWIDRDESVGQIAAEELALRTLETHMSAAVRARTATR